MRMILTPYSDTNYDEIEFRSFKIEFPYGEYRSANVKLIGGGNYQHRASFSNADRQCRITGTITEVQAAIIAEWIKDGIDIYFSDEYASYKGFIKSFDQGGGQSTIVIQISELILKHSDIVYPPPPPPPESEWYDITDNTYWEPSGSSVLVWDGSKWTNSGYGDIALSAIGGWNADFYPTKGRITYSSVNIDINTLTVTAGYFGPISSDVEFNVDGEGEIVTALDFAMTTPTGPWTINIEQIEFFGIMP